MNKTTHGDHRGAKWLWPLLAASAMASVCGGPQTSGPAVAGRTGTIVVESTPVPLNPNDPSATSVGDFHYAGGLVLGSRQTDLLHELSDLVLTGNDQFVAVGDEGVLVEGRLVFDPGGRLAGVTDASVTRLIGLDGTPLTPPDTDAEGLALLPDGDRIVSFERVPRIWLYPRNGGPPRAIPSPESDFSPNAGMEALTTDPDVRGDAYSVGAEDSGATWTCRVTAPCVPGATVVMPPEFALVSMAQLPQGRIAHLLRAYDPARGNRVMLTILRDTTLVVDRLDLALPMTVDNFEGLAAVPRADGGMRFYLLSDDNNSASQRTILLAFDWKPQ